MTYSKVEYQQKLQDIMDEFSKGTLHKIEAIKRIRAATEWSLREAKEAFENWESKPHFITQSRTFTDILFEVLDACRTRVGAGWIKQVVPIIWGDRGAGKSYMYRDYSESRKLRYIPIHFGQFDSPGDVLGMGYLEDLKKVKARNGRPILSKVTRLAQPDWFPTDDVPTFLHCDEVNRANNLVSQLLHALLLDRKVGQHHLPDNCFVACSANPPESEFGVSDLDVAVMDRLLHISMPEDKAGTDWISWALRDGVDSRIISLVSENPSLIASKSYAVPRDRPSRRSWHMLSILLGKNYDDLSNEAIYIISVGLLGVNASRIFMEYVKDASKADRPISPVSILGDYESVRLRIKMMASWRFRRTDILSQTIFQLNNILKTAVSLTATQLANLELFRNDLPDEMRESIWKEVKK